MAATHYNDERTQLFKELRDKVVLFLLTPFEDQIQKIQQLCESQKDDNWTDAEDVNAHQLKKYLINILTDPIEIPKYIDDLIAFVPPAKNKSAAADSKVKLKSEVDVLREVTNAALNFLTSKVDYAKYYFQNLPLEKIKAMNWETIYPLLENLTRFDNEKATQLAELIAQNADPVDDQKVDQKIVPATQQDDQKVVSAVQPKKNKKFTPKEDLIPALETYLKVLDSLEKKLEKPTQYIIDIKEDFINGEFKKVDTDLLKNYCDLNTLFKVEEEVQDEKRGNENERAAAKAYNYAIWQDAIKKTKAKVAYKIRLINEYLEDLRNEDVDEKENGVAVALAKPSEKTEKTVTHKVELPAFKKILSDQDATAHVKLAEFIQEVAASKREAIKPALDLSVPSPTDKDEKRLAVTGSPMSVANLSSPTGSAGSAGSSQSPVSVISPTNADYSVEVVVVSNDSSAAGTSSMIIQALRVSDSSVVDRKNVGAQSLQLQTGPTGLADVAISIPEVNSAKPHSAAAEPSSPVGLKRVGAFYSLWNYFKGKDSDNESEDSLTLSPKTP